MAVIKCKMCGGDLTVEAESGIAVCEYCGTKQTVSKTADNVIANLYNRANNLRMKCEFDKAAQAYEKIVQQDDGEAEAHWGIVLCKYGIEYVDDPATGKKVPTCHRTLFGAVTADADYQAAVDYADGAQQAVYESEARAIDRLQKDILAIVKNEKPFDVFICYKETDENGKRTVDSVIANDIYHQLTAEGMKVFYAAITLEDKLGQEYEPYIFAALNSAKVMLVIGTRPEHFSAVWVKNEWSRFLALMKSDPKKLLIPCYRDMDAYDLPEEFAHLQAQDMSKIGFINDVVRGIKKVAGKQPVPAAPVASAPGGESGNLSALLKRGFLALEDGEWQKADDFFEQALNLDAELGEAYLGKLMAELHVRMREQLGAQKESFEDRKNCQKAMRFGDDALKAELQGYVEQVRQEEERKKEQERSERYDKATWDAEQTDLAVLRRAYDAFSVLGNYRDAKEKASKILSILNTENAKARKNSKLAEGMISAGSSHTVGLKSDGTVVATKHTDLFYCGQCEVSGWTDIVAISAGDLYTVGLRSNGTVVATKFIESRLDCGQCEVSGWTDIVAISAGSCHTVGLKSDGTVVATKFTGEQDHYYNRCEVSGWTGIVAIAAGAFHTVGLKSDGTVVAVGVNSAGQCEVSDWTDIVAIAAGEDHTVGLKSDGTVVVAGFNLQGECEVSGWTDIVAIAAGEHNTVGLKSDGTVVAVGVNSAGQCEASDWTDIVAIAAGEYHTVGLKSNGTVVATGDNEDGECEVSDWKLFNRFDTIDQEREARRFAAAKEMEELRRAAEEERRIAAEKKAEEEARHAEEVARRKAALESEWSQLQTELANLKGLFSGGRRREIERRMDAIDDEMAVLECRENLIPETTSKPKPAPPAPAPAHDAKPTAVSAVDTPVKSPIPGNVFKVECRVGQRVNAGDVLVVLEAMKMEIEISAPIAGTVKAIPATVGTAIKADDLLVVLS